MGFVSGSAWISIENSYVTNNISAMAFGHAFSGAFGHDSNAGALMGRGRLANTPGSIVHSPGGLEALPGTNYRLNTQSLSADPRLIFGGNRGNTNTTGISGALTQTQMRNSNSFSGWDFNVVWMTDSARNNGYPIHRAVERSFAVIAAQPTTTFSNGFTGVIGSDTPLELSVDMPVQSFAGVSVNGSALIQDTHFTVASGSTQITLLPNFLDTLEEGFHALEIAFEGGVLVEEHIFIAQPHLLDAMPVSRLYHDGALIFTIEDGPLVSEDYFDSLVMGEHNFRAEFVDGQVIEEVVFIGEDETFLEDNRSLLAFAGDFPALLVMMGALALTIVVGTVVILSKNNGYSFVAGIPLKKWIVKHTVSENSASASSTIKPSVNAYQPAVINPSSIPTKNPAPSVDLGVNAGSRQSKLQQPMFCVKCGSVISNQTIFCKRCGHEIHHRIPRFGK